MIFTILGLLCGIVIFIKALFNNKSEYIIIGGFLIVFNVVVLGLHLKNRKEDDKECIESTLHTTIDFSKGNTTEKITIITYEDSIPLDTVVIFR